MMRYLPHTPEDIRSMLAALGVKDLDGLFASIRRTAGAAIRWTCRP